MIKWLKNEISSKHCDASKNWMSECKHCSTLQGVLKQLSPWQMKTKMLRQQNGSFWNELSPRIENATNDEEFCNWSSPASSAMMNEQRSYEWERNLKWFEGVFAKFLHTIQTPPSREFSNEFSPRDEGCDDRRTVDEDWKKIEGKWNFAKVHKMQISGGVLDARRTPWWLIITRWRNLGKLAIWSDVT